jgi:2-amino-4-hydroxy-6-hydroxymethyldihydropteridine diphosphokinase
VRVESGASSRYLDAVVGMGANLGERRTTLLATLEDLSQIGQLVCVSRLFETEPLGPPQPRYLNAAARLLVDLAPLELLGRMLKLERMRGRVRRERWGPRVLDLDLLWCAGRAIDEQGLSVPHPGLTRRCFALLPLLDVAPEASDPRTGVRYTERLKELDCASVVTKSWRCA